MPKFIADFHIHSKYSMATSKQLTPKWLDYWSRIKGISVMGTGDFTHPKWLAELQEQLEPAEQGLFTLKPEFREVADWVPQGKTRFMLTAEISSIYKKGGKTRKVHNILWAPSFELAQKVQDEFIRRGFNIKSDGRPIIGLDSRDLLELVLAISEDIKLVPAHIWTPWFSALGAKSGFDSIEECYGDLEPYIFAVETGLSSDAPMNWMCSSLDKYALLSNSDAHSPEKLGRNANIFNCEMSFNGIVQALKDKKSKTFIGTIDTYPQAGKYHYSGHRKCEVCSTPDEVLAHKFLCPTCKKPYTLGVMDRVAQLADRADISSCYARQSIDYIISLPELLSHIHGVSETSKKIKTLYPTIIKELGTEFGILTEISISDIAQKTDGFIAEGIRRMREGEIIVSEGFDGEYGEIQVFTKEELESYKTNSSFVPKKNKIKKAKRELFDLEKYKELAKTTDFSILLGKKPDGQLQLFNLNSI